MKGNVGMRKKNDTKEENGKLLLSVKETCELTGLSEKTVYPESRGERFPTAAMPATCDAG